MNEISIKKIRVLIADDSLFMRTYLSALLRADDEIEIVGTASTGAEAVALSITLMPDVITMDYHMPEKNGIEASVEIMKKGNPPPAIIMLSAFSGSDGERAKRKLEATGAHVIMKPSGEVSLDIGKIAESIIQKIKDIGRVEVQMRSLRRQHAQSRVVQLKKYPSTSAPLGIVVIGASTGGPPLVEYLLTTIDPNPGIAIVVVQHMSEYFTELFAERLNRVSKFLVRQAVSRDTLEAGVALVVPGGHMLSLDVGATDKCTFLVSSTSEDLHEIAIDSTMETIAKCYVGKLVGVLLSGMGKDGALGLASIYRHGGLSLVQDPTSAIVNAMPSNALKDMAGKEIVSVREIPPRIRAYMADPSVS